MRIRRLAHLEVSVDYSQCVQVLYGQCDLSTVETSPLLREHSLARQMKEELSSVHVLHYKAQAIIGLK